MSANYFEVLGVRLAAAGNQVCYLVRRATQARALRAGVWLEDPGSGEVLQAGVKAVTTFAEAADYTTRSVSDQTSGRQNPSRTGLGDVPLSVAGGR